MLGSATDLCCSIALATITICVLQGSQGMILTYFGKICEFLGPERFRIWQSIFRPTELEKCCLSPLSAELRSLRKSLLEKEKK